MAMSHHPIGIAGLERNNESQSNETRFTCHPGGTTEAAIIISVGSLGVGANLVLMFLILSKRYLRRSVAAGAHLPHCPTVTLSHL